MRVPPNEMETFLGLCAMTGSDLYQSQAAGGNISVKLNASEMLIKSSGVRLEEVRRDFGWSVMRYQDLPQQLESLSSRRLSPLESEVEYARLIGDAGAAAGNRPSMEAGFHSVIRDKIVVHLHSIAGILLGLLPQQTALQRLEECFRGSVEIQFVPVHLPGFGVTDAIRKLHWNVSEKIRICILSNHGIVWSSMEADHLKKMILQFEDFFEKLFRVREYAPFHELGTENCRRQDKVSPKKDERVKTVCMCHWPHCAIMMEPSFPDFIMYFDFWTGNEDLRKVNDCALEIRSPSAKKLKDQEETLFAHAAVCSIADRGKFLHFMPREMIYTIKNLETEKLRFSQTKDR